MFNVFVTELICACNCFTVVESSLTEFKTIFVELFSICSSSSVFTVLLLFGLFETSSGCVCLVVLCRILDDRLLVVVLVGGILKNLTEMCQFLMNSIVHPIIMALVKNVYMFI